MSACGRWPLLAGSPGLWAGTCRRHSVVVDLLNLPTSSPPIAACSFFMLLLFLVNVAVTVGDPKRPYALSNTNPEVSSVEAIPACDSAIYIRPPCYDFFYTPNNDPNINVRRHRHILPGVG